MRKGSILVTTQRVDTKDPVLSFFLDWIREFAKHFETVYVVCLYAGEYSLPPNVIVLSLGKEEGKSRTTYMWRFYKYVLPLILRRKVKRIFVHMNEIYVLLLLPLLPIRVLFGIPLFWWKTQAKLGLFARAMRFFVTRIFTASEHGFKVHSHKVTVTGHGINTNYFIPPKQKKYSENLRMYAIGRAVPVKHYEDILAALGVLRKSVQNFSLTILGVRSEDRTAYVASLERQIVALGLSECVALRPPVSFSEMVSVYQAADVVINMTYPDTFDKVLLEAMSCGVIGVTPTPSYEKILSPFGLFPRDRSRDELARVLEKVCQMSQAERENLGRVFREEVIAHHNVTKLIDRISSY